MPGRRGPSGAEVAAAGGVLESMLGLLEGGATHIGVATDQVIRSFRNDLYEGYKTGEGVEPDLMSQFPILETVLEATGFAVFKMLEHEADDALATAAAIAAADPRVEKVWILTPDKDLAQCVSDPVVVQYDRRQDREYDEAAVVEKFGVPPGSIPDYLALTGDSADGFPGLPGWGAKSSATVLAYYGYIEAIPDDPEEWDVQVRGAARLAQALVAGPLRRPPVQTARHPRHRRARHRRRRRLGVARPGGRTTRWSRCASPSDGRSSPIACAASPPRESG